MSRYFWSSLQIRVFAIERFRRFKVRRFVYRPPEPDPDSLDSCLKASTVGRFANEDGFHGRPSFHAASRHPAAGHPPRRPNRADGRAAAPAAAAAGRAQETPSRRRRTRETLRRRSQVG